MTLMVAYMKLFCSMNSQLLYYCVRPIGHHTERDLILILSKLYTVDDTPELENV